jgi:hypothetical protein
VPEEEAHTLTVGSGYAAAAAVQQKSTATQLDGGGSGGRRDTVGSSKRYILKCQCADSHLQARAGTGRGRSRRVPRADGSVGDASLV